MTPTTTDLQGVLRQARLLTAAQLDQLPALFQRNPTPALFLHALIHRGWLTPFMARRLWHGQAHHLLLGPYVLIGRLGKGGTGQVFKARHRFLERVVAIKVIRPDYLSDDASIRRFLREMQILARLAHPNVIYAFDADRAGGHYYLVTEYVEGLTLNRLVEAHGPAPVVLACRWVRQAALGLQHAYERGLVHRDVKPSNLIVGRVPGGAAVPYGPSWLTAAATVKILDMGLARVQVPEGVPSGTVELTQLGMVLGSVDFIAPEQAQDPTRADVRSDLYSLGCTFYYLLTGRVPFPADQPLDCLLRHQMDEPPAVDRARPGVPPAVAAVVRKLMSKHPAHRYQTPAALARVLDQLENPGFYQPDQADTRPLPMGRVA